MSHLISLNYEFSYSLLLQQNWPELISLGFDASEVADYDKKADLFEMVFI